MNPSTQENTDRALRPKGFTDFLGQEEIKYNLYVCVSAALQRKEILDHILLAGPPGLGKTTLAGILANEMGTRLITVNAPSIKTKGEIVALLSGLRKGDILFFDEIHGLNPKIEEILYPAMEDFKLEVVAGNQAITIRIEPFTLIGATTRAGMLQRPLRDRFGVHVDMKPYNIHELTTMVQQNGRKIGIEVDFEGATELAKRSHGTPRIVNKLLRRTRDFAQVNGLNVIDSETVKKTCYYLGIDSIGLDSVSQCYLKILTEKNRPMALTTMVSLIGESKDTIEETIEPRLMRLGFIDKTPKGRVATPAAFKHLHPEKN
jgi:Holliday junction DNA helicase RuvB